MTTTITPAWIVDALGLERVMFGAAGPDPFARYVKKYGPEAEGIWGTADSWGKVITYKG